jgi:FkbM family methyltransferase
VVAVDADPRQCERAGKRLRAHVASGDLVIECCGIGPVAGERTFYRSKNDYWSSFDVGLAGRRETKTQAITVPCRTPYSLFETYGVPHYLKVDIEGSDRCVVDAVALFGIRPRFLSIELSHCHDIDAVAALGYTRFAVVDQSKLSPSGNPSGPFGDAIAGPWVDAAEAHRLYADGRANPLSWFDLHAQ